MRRPETGLFKAHGGQADRHPCDIAGLFRQSDHLRDQIIIAPAVRLGAKALDQAAQLIGIGNMAADGVSLDRHFANIQQFQRARHLVDRIRQFSNHGILGGQREQLPFIRLNEALQNIAAGREFDMQQRRGFLAGGQQYELAVTSMRIQIKPVAEFVANLGAKA